MTGFEFLRFFLAFSFVFCVCKTGFSSSAALKTKDAKHTQKSKGDLEKMSEKVKSIKSELKNIRRVVAKEIGAVNTLKQNSNSLAVQSTTLQTALTHSIDSNSLYQSRQLTAETKLRLLRRIAVVASTKAIVKYAKDSTESHVKHILPYVLRKALKEYWSILHDRSEFAKKAVEYDSTAIAAELQIQSILAGQKNTQQRIQKKQYTIDELLHRQSELEKNIKKQESSIKELASIIQVLEKKANRQKKARAYSNRSRQVASPPNRKEITDNIASSKYSFRCLPPVSSTKILHHYGIFHSQGYGVKRFNPGVDFSAPIGSVVYASSPGNIARIEWLAGYNTVVIIDHGNGFRTVYGNLQSASVKIGQKIGAGAEIGKSGSNADGSYVHFEVWNGKNHVNPEDFF